LSFFIIFLAQVDLTAWNWYYCSNRDL